MITYISISIYLYLYTYIYILYIYIFIYIYIYNMAHLLNKTPEFIEQNTSRALQKPQYNKILRKHKKKKSIQKL